MNKTKQKNPHSNCASLVIRENSNTEKNRAHQMLSGKYSKNRKNGRVLCASMFIIK